MAIGNKSLKQNLQRRANATTPQAIVMRKPTVPLRPLGRSWPKTKSVTRHGKQYPGS
jgi:hypothetical protein